MSGSDMSLLTIFTSENPNEPMKVVVHAGAILDDFRMSLEDEFDVSTKWRLGDEEIWLRLRDSRFEEHPIEGTFFLLVGTREPLDADLTLEKSEFERITWSTDRES